MKYVLMNKDLELARFSVKDIGEDFFEVEDYNVLSEFPFRSLESFHAFLENRKPPKNRAYIDILLDKMQIKSMSGYLNVSYALSLNDTLWVKPENALLTWNEVSLYVNEFNDIIAHLAFSGQGLAGLPLKSTSPEFSTEGMLPKCWKRFDGKIYLLKGGTSGCSNTGNEPYSEYYVTQIEEAMQLPKFVSYDLIKFKGMLASKCELFTSEDYGYRPFYAMYSPKDMFGVISAYKSLGMIDDFNDLMILDAVTLNTDRHLSNYGFLIDNNTLEIIDSAPIFDNGLGLLPYYVMENDLMTYAAKMAQNSGLSFSTIAQLCLTDRQRKMLKRLIGFKFKRHPTYNLPEERLERLELLVQERVKTLLTI